MKSLIAVSLIILITSQVVNAAGFWDNLTPRGRTVVKAGIGMAGAFENSGRSAQVVAAATQDLCLEKFEKAQEAWSTKSDVDLLGVIYLQYPLYDGLVKKLSLDINDVPANSWNPTLAPHIDSQCKKFWNEVGESQLFENDKGSLCKVSTVGFSGHQYDLVACSGEMDIRVDLHSIK